METTKKRDWGLVAAGILLVVCAFFIIAMPGLTLVTLTAIAGAGFLVSGIFDIINYVRFRKQMNLSGWAIAYAILGIILGLMLLLHPLALSGVIPWIVGVGFVVFGIFEIVGSIKIKGTGVPMWGWMLFSGIVSVLCGITFFVNPATFSIFLAVFVMMRGFSLVAYGWNTSKGILA